MNRDELTRVSLRFITDLRQKLGQSHTEFAYECKTVRDLLGAVSQQFEASDLLIAGQKPLPFIQMVIDGRLSYTVGGLDGRIPDGAAVALISYCGVLTPVPLARLTKMREHSERGT